MTCTCFQLPTEVKSSFKNAFDFIEDMIKFSAAKRIIAVLTLCMCYDCAIL